MRALDLSGQTFGNLTVTERAGRIIFPGGHTKVTWKCRCVCGAEATVRTDFLRSGTQRSCGCRKGQAYDTLGYMAVHLRLRKEFGPASEYDCVDCAGAADEWSYEGEGTHSEDLDLYQARCKQCHIHYDGLRRAS